MFQFNLSLRKFILISKNHIMNLKSILIALFLISGVTLSSQTQNRKIYDEKAGDNVLIGKCNRKGLKTGNFGFNFIAKYKEYNPSASVIEKIKEHLNGVTITVVLGTWCSDTELQLPRFFKIMDLANFNEKNISLIGVDTKKQTYITDISDLEIKLIPTFIFYRDGKEIGRIVESPKRSLEKDILKKIK